MSLRQRFDRELHEYLADFRNLRDELKSTEGWTALILIAVILVLAGTWFFYGLGFDRLLSVATSWNVWRPANCRDISDFRGLFLVLDGFFFMLVAVYATGEMMLLIDRRRRKRLPKPSSVLIPAMAMLVSGLAGIVAMRVWC